MNPRVVHHVRLAAACAVLLTWAHAAAGQGGGNEAALAVFHEHLNLYAALHRKLEGPLPPRETAHQRFSDVVARRYLASAIRGARPSARQGDIIDPAAARVFRAIMAETCATPDGALIAREFQGRAARPVPDPVVNEPYPIEAASVIPESVLQRLPALAEDVEYRAVNDDLVLWDIHAQIVVDVLPDAFSCQR